MSLKVGEAATSCSPFAGLVGDCFGDTEEGDTFLSVSFFLIFDGDLVGDSGFLSLFTFVGESKELVEELLEEESPPSEVFGGLTGFRTDSSCVLAVRDDFGKGRGTDLTFSEGTTVALSLFVNERGGSVRLSRTFALLLFTTILLVESTCGLDSN